MSARRGWRRDARLAPAALPGPGSPGREVGSARIAERRRQLAGAGLVNQATPGVKPARDSGSFVIGKNVGDVEGRVERGRGWGKRRRSGVPRKNEWKEEEEELNAALHIRVPACTKSRREETRSTSVELLRPDELQTRRGSPRVSAFSSPGEVHPSIKHGRHAADVASAGPDDRKKGTQFEEKEKKCRMTHYSMSVMMTERVSVMSDSLGLRRLQDYSTLQNSCRSLS
ncbi:hypothetical protein Bbelb_122460 [Branchiostoma belcheri]|nr:hypothetical protein Bbelb_122460 [Branchiostoma belcheri]